MLYMTLAVGAAGATVFTGAKFLRESGEGVTVCFRSGPSTWGDLTADVLVQVQICVQSIANCESFGDSRALLLSKR